MHPYAGNPAVYPTTISLIDDSDAPDAANFNPAPQALADRTAFINANSLYRTGGSVTGTIEFAIGSILQIDAGAQISLNGLLQVGSGGLIQLGPGSELLAAFGSNIVVNPGATETIAGTLTFSTGSSLGGTVSGGTLHSNGNTISLDAGAGLIANAVNAIEVAAVHGITFTGGSALWESGSFAEFQSGSSLSLDAGTTVALSGTLNVLASSGVQVQSGASIAIENGGSLSTASGGQIVLGAGSQLVLASGVPTRRNTSAAAPPATMAVGDVTEFALTETTTTSGGVNTASFTFTVPVGSAMAVDMTILMKNPDGSLLLAAPLRVLAGGYNNAGSMTSVSVVIESNPEGISVTPTVTAFLGTFTVHLAYSYSGGATLSWTAVCRAVIL